MPKKEPVTLSVPITMAEELGVVKAGIKAGTPQHVQAIAAALQGQLGHLRPKPKIEADAQAIRVTLGRELAQDELLDLREQLVAAWHNGQEPGASLVLRLLASVPTDQCRILAEGLLQTADFPGAEEFLLHRAQADTSRFREVYLATAVLLLGRVNEAETIFQPVFNDPPDYSIQDLQAATGLGICRLLAGNQQSARDLLSKVVGQVVKPKWGGFQMLHLVIRLNLARACRHWGDTTEARNQYDQLIAKLKADGEDGGWLAAVLEERDNRLGLQPGLWCIADPRTCTVFLQDKSDPATAALVAGADEEVRSLQTSVAAREMEIRELESAANALGEVAEHRKLIQQVLQRLRPQTDGGPSAAEAGRAATELQDRVAEAEQFLAQLDPAIAERIHAGETLRQLAELKAAFPARAEREGVEQPNRNTSDAGEGG